jgi:hypothetical protein
MNEKKVAPSNEERGSGMMRVLDFRRIGAHTYQVVTESAKHGRVTQKILVLPSSPANSEVTKPCNDDH